MCQLRRIQHILCGRCDYDVAFQPSINKEVVFIAKWMKFWILFLGREKIDIQLNEVHVALMIFISSLFRVIRKCLTVKLSSFFWGAELQEQRSNVFLINLIVIGLCGIWLEAFGYNFYFQFKLEAKLFFDFCKLPLNVF